MAAKEAQEADTKSASGLLIVEGGFEDQAGELASYLERVQKTKSEALSEENLVELLKKGDNDEVVRLLTAESAALSTASEKEFEPAYNLLISLILLSKSTAELLDQVVARLSTPPSFPQGPSVSIAILTTIFNLVPELPDIEFKIFKTVLSIAAEYNLYDYASPYFKSVNQWLSEWNVNEEERMQVWTKIIAMADKADDPELYNILLSALSVTSSPDKALITKAIQVGVSLPQLFDFQELVSLPCVQQLQKDQDPAYEFLQLLLTGDLETYRNFIKSHPSFCADNHIDESKAERKVRLLTLASLANTPSRTLPYSKIVTALDIPSEDVEMWLIDVIRAGLVEGKLSQYRQELLVHRSTYRTFGREEWEELDARLEEWKVALEGVLSGDHAALLKEQTQSQEVAVTNGTSGAHEIQT